MSETDVDITICRSREDFRLAERLTRDYVKWLNMDLSFQDIDLELKTFSTMYAPPRGLFLIARQGSQLVGGVGYRSLGAGVCEMKRLFVYQKFQGQGIGRMLCVKLIREARAARFKSMRLDTLGTMLEAIALYLDLGFEPIRAYRYNPDPNARYYELNLRKVELPDDA